MLEPGEDFFQQTLDDALLDDLEQLVHLAIREDLGRGFDLTTVAVVPEGLAARAHIVPRKSGTAAGLALIAPIVDMLDAEIQVTQHVADGDAFEAGSRLATLEGDARDVLTCERTILNFLGRLCGIASLTRQYVDLIAGQPARVYDTRKTTPGWRRLEKYAVHCGGGRNHRSGLYEAVMIKDNHLACRARLTGQETSPAEAVRRARDFLKQQPLVDDEAILEIEIDSLDQLASALSAEPDIILLDNMDQSELRAAVAQRNQLQPQVQLEASGGVHLESIRGIAETGIERISVGALTHSAINLDLGLDWE